MFKIKYQLISRYYNNEEDQNPAMITHNYTTEKLAKKVMKICTETDGEDIEYKNDYLSITKNRITGAICVHEIHPIIINTNENAPLKTI